MSRWLVMAVLVVIGACSKPDAAAPGPEASMTSEAAPDPADGGLPAPDSVLEADAGHRKIRCVLQTFAVSAPIAEASGAVVVPASEHEASHLVVVGDSGTSGAFVRLDASTGALLAKGRLPLGRGASDDLEGLAYAGGVYYAVTSAGMVREWKRKGKGYRLIRGPYPIGSARRGEICGDPNDTNCGPDYEGLCLRAGGPESEGRCIGFAASRTTGALHCVVRRGEKIAIGTGRVPISRRKTLTGCDIEPDRDGAVWAGTNVFGASLVYRVRNWGDPARAVVDRIGPLGAGFPEATAIGRGGSLYRFSDTGGTPSLMNKYLCE